MQAIARIEAARREGLRITTDMYAYPAASTGLDAAMPPWVQEGGNAAWYARLRDPAVRARVAAEMRQEDAGWNNTLREAGGADNVLIASLRNPALKPLIGKTLAADRGRARRVGGRGRDGPGRRRREPCRLRSTS